MGKLRKKLKRVYIRIVAAKGSPQQVAAGLALGVFLGMAVPWGLQIAAAVVAATILNVARVPAVIGVNVTNLLTIGFLYPLAWRIGNWVLKPFTGGSQPIDWGKMEHTLRTFLGLAGGVLLRMTIGGILMGVVFAVITYFLTLWGLVRFREKVKQRRAARRLARLSARPPAGSQALGPPGAERSANPPREAATRS